MCEQEILFRKFLNILQAPKKYNYGFSLAEILITVGIIGIVAAVVLTSVSLNYKKKVIATRLEKVYSDLLQALKMSELENGPCENWDWANFDNWYKSDSFANEYLFNYMAGTKSEVYHHGDWFPKTPNGGRVFRTNKIHSWNDVLIGFSGGTVVGNSTKYEYSTLLILVDIDGLKGKDAFGSDVFVFSLSRDGKLTPYCSDSARAVMLNDNRGVCGSAIISLDGWKIADDYPYKL